MPKGAPPLRSGPDDDERATLEDGVSPSGEVTGEAKRLAASPGLRTVAHVENQRDDQQSTNSPPAMMSAGVSASDAAYALHQVMLMHRSSGILRTSFAFAVVGAIGLCSTPALADIPLSLDLDYALPVDAGPMDDGFGGALRFGPRIDLKLLTLAGEAGLGIHDFSGPDGATVYRGVVGGRLGLGYLLRPSIFGHLGVGHADWSSTEDLTHLTLDIGASLDVTLLPAFELGVHAAYNYLAGNGSVGGLGFMTLGGHLTFVLHPDDDDADGD